MSDASDSPRSALSSPAGSSPAQRSPRKEASVEPSSGGSSPVRQKPRARNDDLMDEDDGDGDGGLFGEDSGDESDSRQKRTLDDADLDSGDDEGRRDRLDESEPDVEQKVINTVDISLGRHGVPRGSDGEIYLLRNAQSTGIEHRIFDAKTFKPPTSSHHGAPTLKGFSAAHTANTTIRWRRDPDDPRRLQSNSRIIRWSDGSLTLQIATNPTEQLELPAKALAPPQTNPRIPTPTSYAAGAKNGSATGYDARMDSHTYLASVHQEAQFIRLTNHATAALTVQTSMLEEEDDALLRLQESMAAARAGANKQNGQGGAEGRPAGPALMDSLEDPELAKKRAEAAEKEKLKAERRRANQEQRMRERQDRAFGRVSSGGRAAGLTVGGLEDDGLGRARPRASAARRPRRRGSEYSDDEDDGFRRGKTREDEYDEDDGFLVASDEEPEVVEDDDEEEEILEDDDAEGDADDRPARPPRSPKRPREDDADAGAGAGGGKRGRRRVLDDEDDE